MRTNRENQLVEQGAFFELINFAFVFDFGVLHDIC